MSIPGIDCAVAIAGAVKVEAASNVVDNKVSRMPDSGVQGRIVRSIPLPTRLADRYSTPL
jgi:hypothetical protein